MEEREPALTPLTPLEWRGLDAYVRIVLGERLHQLRALQRRLGGPESDPYIQLRLLYDEWQAEHRK